MILIAALCMVGGPLLLFSSLGAAVSGTPLWLVGTESVIPVALAGGTLPFVGLLLARYAAGGRPAVGMLLTLLVASIVLFLLGTLTPGWLPRFPEHEWTAVRELLVTELQRLR